MNKESTVNNAITNLISTIKHTQWYNLLKGFLLSEDIKKLMVNLFDKAVKGERFTPLVKLLFKPFIECELENLKIIIIADKPYNDIGIADGLAFSCNNASNFRSREYNTLMDAINKSVYKGKKVKQDFDRDLSRWSHQGILLLNQSMTTGLTSHLGHKDIWKPFINYVIDMLIARKQEYIWILMGNDCQDLADLLEDENLIQIEHPTSVHHSMEQPWDYKDVFNECNKKLKELGKEPIEW